MRSNNLVIPAILLILFCIVCIAFVVITPAQATDMNETRQTQALESIAKSLERISSQCH